MPKNNRVPEVKVGLLVQYIAVIIFILSICYIVIVTNPPAELLEYNENLRGMVTRQLSYHDFTNYRASLFPFLALFALIMFFSGYLAGLIIVREAGKKLAIAVIPLAFIFISIVMLGYMLLPYYGFDLVLVAYAIGAPAYFTGTMSEKSIVLRTAAFVTWIVTALITGIDTNLGIGLAILLGGAIITLIVEILLYLAIQDRKNNE